MLKNCEPKLINDNETYCHDLDTIFAVYDVGKITINCPVIGVLEINFQPVPFTSWHYYGYPTIGHFQVAVISSLGARPFI